MHLMNQNKHHDSAPKTGDDDWRAEHQFRKVEQICSNAVRIAGESDDDYTRRLHDEHAKALDIKQMAGEAADAFQARVTRTIKGLERRAAWVRDSVAGGIAKAGQFMHDQNPLAAGAIGALLGSLAPLSSLARDKRQGVGGEAMKAGANLAERGAAKVEKAAASIVHQIVRSQMPQRADASASARLRCAKVASRNICITAIDPSQL